MKGRDPHAIDLTLHLSSAYQGLSVLVTILVTSSISYRLMKEQKRLVGLLGREVTAKYTSASAILIESALPFTIFGIGTVILSSISTRRAAGGPMALAIVTSVVDSLWYCSSVSAPLFSLQGELTRAHGRKPGAMSASHHIPCDNWPVIRKRLERFDEPRAFANPFLAIRAERQREDSRDREYCF